MAAMGGEPHDSASICSINDFVGVNRSEPELRRVTLQYATREDLSV
jgi:hypothetical protein